MPTIHDVARRAAVSAATVSRVLNGHTGVDPVRAERVRAAAAELDYRINAVARNLRRSQTTLWGVIVPDLSTPFFTDLVRGLEDVARSAGFRVVLGNSDGDPARQAGYVSAVLAERMAGAVVAPTGGTAGLAALVDSGTPMVSVEHEIRGARVDLVEVGNEDGARDATRHLLQARYTRVACVTGDRGDRVMNRRLRGYGRALRAAGHAFDPDLVRHGDRRGGGGYAAMRALLAGPAPPDAVLAASSRMVPDVLACLADHRKRLGVDVGVVGFGGIPWARAVRPALTTVTPPAYRLGRAAGELLLDRLAVPERPAHTVRLPARLQVRQSSTREPPA